MRLISLSRYIWLPIYGSNYLCLYLCIVSIVYIYIYIYIYIFLIVSILSLSLSPPPSLSFSLVPYLSVSLLLSLYLPGNVTSQNCFYFSSILYKTIFIFHHTLLSDCNELQLWKSASIFVVLPPSGNLSFF